MSRSYGAIDLKSRAFTDICGYSFSPVDPFTDAFREFHYVLYDETGEFSQGTCSDRDHRKFCEMHEYMQNPNFGDR